MNAILDFLRRLPRAVLNRIEFRVLHALDHSVHPTVLSIASEVAQERGQLERVEKTLETVVHVVASASSLSNDTAAQVQHLSRSIGDLGQNVSHLLAAVAAIETRVAALQKSVSEFAASTPSEERLSDLLLFQTAPVQARLARLSDDLNRGFDVIGERLVDTAKRFEVVEPRLIELGGASQAAGEHLEELAQRLDRISERVFDEIGKRLDSLGRNILDAGPRFDEVDLRTGAIAAQIDNLERHAGSRFDDLGRSVSSLGRNILDTGARFDGIDRTSGALAAQLDALSLLSRDGLRRLAEDTQAAEGRFTHIAERLNELYAVGTHGLSRQIIELDDDLVCVRTPMGWIVVPREEHRSLVHLSDGWTYHEPGTLKVVQALLRPGDSAVDVGAHVGLITLPMADAVGPEGRVYAFEPQPRLVSALTKTLELNGVASRVSILNVAAGENSGDVSLYSGDTAMSASLFPTSGGAVVQHVPMTSVDEAIGEAKNIRLIKVDAEGAELLVLKGMRNMLSRNTEALIIAEMGPEHLRRTGTRLEAWLSAFAQSGYTEVYQISESNIGPLVVKNPQLRDLETVVSANLLLTSKHLCAAVEQLI